MLIRFFARFKSISGKFSSGALAAIADAGRVWRTYHSGMGLGGALGLNPQGSDKHAARQFDLGPGGTPLDVVVDHAHRLHE